MNPHLRLPAILVGSLLMVSPIMGAFINGEIPLPDFLLRYLLSLVFWTAAVWVFNLIFDGYQRANDHAHQREMHRLRMEEYERTQERIREERKARIQSIADAANPKQMDENE